MLNNVHVGSVSFGPRVAPTSRALHSAENGPPWKAPSLGAVIEAGSSNVHSESANILLVLLFFLTSSEKLLQVFFAAEPHLGDAGLFKGGRKDRCNPCRSCSGIVQFTLGLLRWAASRFSSCVTYFWGLPRPRRGG